jgi:hypothetical protein
MIKASGAKAAACSTEVDCLSMLDDATAVRVNELLMSRGISLTLHHPKSLLEARELIAKQPLSALLTNNPGIADGDAHLSTHIRIRAVSHPSVLLWHEGALDEATSERLRVAGVSAVVNSMNLVDVFEGLTGKGALTSRLDQIPLDNMLQTIEQRPGEHLVIVECPHWQGLSGYPWSRTSTRFCHGDPDSDSGCQGWFGRIYIKRGGLYHAETPSREGIRAPGAHVGAEKRFGPCEAAVHSSTARKPLWHSTAMHYSRSGRD